MNRLPLIGLLPLVLAACQTGDTGNAAAAACRERAAAMTGVPYDATSARILGPNISGVASYQVSAGPQVFICNARSNGVLVSFIPQ
jgi:hypothetical protein